VTGAIGFELLEAAHTEMHGMDSLGFGILYSIEETLEISRHDGNLGIHGLRERALWRAGCQNFGGT